MKRAKRVLEDDQAKITFDRSFEENETEIRLRLGEIFGERPFDFLHDDWTNLRKWTVIQLVAIYLAEYNALYETIGLRPFGVEIAMDEETQSSGTCGALIEAARQEREPRDPVVCKIPEPIASLLIDGTVVELKE